MINTFSVESTEYEKMINTIDLHPSEDIKGTEIQMPQRDYLMAWDFGFLPSSGESSAEAI